MMKHLLVVLLALAAPLAAAAQGTITGNIKGLADGKIYYQCHGQVADSAMISGGKFTLHMPAKKGAQYISIVTADQQWGGAFWVMTDQHVTITGDRQKSDIKGAPIEDEYQAYLKFMDPVRQEERAIVAQQNGLLKSGEMDTLDSLEAALDHIRMTKELDTFREFLKAHPSSYISMNTVYNYRVMNKFPYKLYKPMVDQLTPGAFEGEQWETLQRIISEDAAIEPGNMMPDFTLKDVFGDSLRISDYRGRYLLLTIGNTGLKEIKANLPLRVDLYRKYQGRLAMVGDIFCKEPMDIVRLAAQNDMPWVLASDFKTFYSKASELLHIDHTPISFLIDPQGKIIGRDLFGNDLRAAVEKAMAQGGAATAMTTAVEKNNARRNDAAYVTSLRKAIQKADAQTLQLLNSNPKYVYMTGLLPAVDAAFAKMSQKLKDTPEGQQALGYFYAMRPLEIGTKVPDFTLKTADGKDVNLYSFLKGKKAVILDFWASWCGWCRKETPNIKAVWADHHDNPAFDVIGVSFDDKRDRWERGLKEEATPWTQVSDLKGTAKSAVYKWYGLQGIPAIFLIDGNGRVLARDMRGDAIRKNVERHL